MQLVRDDSVAVPSRAPSAQKWANQLRSRMVFPIFPELGVAIYFGGRLQFFNSNFVPSSIRYPICSPCEVDVYFDHYIKKLTIIQSEVRYLHTFLNQFSLQVFKSELSDLLNQLNDLVKYFKILRTKSNRNKFDATDLHNVCNRVSYKLERFINRFAAYLVLNQSSA